MNFDVSSSLTPSRILNTNLRGVVIAYVHKGNTCYSSYSLIFGYTHVYIQEIDSKPPYLAHVGLYIQNMFNKDYILLWKGIKGHAQQHIGRRAMTVVWG